ncbi:MAG: hypothetical protein GC201_10950 [Alphaproteobacteria bacterium]|nr:hypothetical protein [Alphaproteobacteria bacterium]
MKRLAYGLMVGAVASMALAMPAAARDRDNNPPGPAGGPGTNWENPPGPRGGPGASPDRVWRHIHGRDYVFVVTPGGAYFNARFGYWHPTQVHWDRARFRWTDRDDNPPGPVGGRGTNWENPPGPRGGPGTSPDRHGGRI